MKIKVKLLPLAALVSVLVLGCSRSLPFSAEVCSYDGNKITGTYKVENSLISVDENTVWECDVKSSSVRGDRYANDYSLSFSLKKGTMPSAGAAVEFTVDNWNTSNYLFAPSAMYNGNRFRVLKIGYAPFMYNPNDRPKDMPITITNVPHLNSDLSDGKLELMTNSCSTPLVGYYDSVVRRGFFVLTKQDTLIGNNSFTVREYPGQKRLSISMYAPGVREHRYVMCNADNKSNDSAISVKEGDVIQMSFRVYDFPAENLMAFFDKFFSVRKDLSGQNEYRYIASFSSVAEAIYEHHFHHKWYENDTMGYMCNKPEGDHRYSHLQLGWNGVPVYSLIQFADKSYRYEENLRRIRMSFESIKRMQGASGLFYAMMMRGDLSGDAFRDAYKERDVAMIRRTSLTVYYSLQCFDLMKERGLEVDPTWEEMCRKASDAMVDLFQRNGEFGQFVRAETGEIFTPNSTNGALCIAALAYASKYFGDPRYLQMAEKSGQYYYDNHLAKGYVGGGPGEILQAPDSESIAELTESYVALFELTRDKKWLDYARDAAALCSSWVISYDYRFPDGSRMREMGVKATGAVWASIQNEHGAPGIYVMSGDFLLKLYRATGDKRYMELLKDMSHNVIQYVNTDINPIQKKGGSGYTTERVNISDWEGQSGIGGVMDSDSNQAWENVTLYHILQNPGIYVLKDTEELFVIDHVKARIISRDGDSMTLEIENPTPKDASVSIFSENEKDARSVSMGWNQFDRWQRVDVPSNSTITVTIR